MRYVFLVLILSSSISASAQTTMMNEVSLPYLERLIQIGRAYYPKFKATEAKANSARYNYIKAKNAIWDFISLSYVYYPGNAYAIYNGNNTYSLLYAYQAGVFVNVGNMLQKPANVKQARQEYIAAVNDKETTDLDVDLEIRKRYFTYIQTSNVLKIKSKALSDADDALKNIKYKFEKGELTFESYNQSLLALSTFNTEKINAEYAFLVAKSSLEQMLGTKLEDIK